MHIPSVRQIRRQIYFKGSKNTINRWDDEVAEQAFGVPKSHISFIKQTHRHIKRYVEAVEDLKAATFTLSICKSYLLEANDELFAEYWYNYTKIVETGQEPWITRCKEILQFVKYPEGDRLPYDEYDYGNLVKLARYHSITEYPPFYISFYDILNEFDLKLDRSLKDEAVVAYANEYLDPQPYTVGNYVEIVNRLEKAMLVMAKCIPRSRRTAIRKAVSLEKPLKQRLNKVGNSYTTLGDKRYEFFYKLFTYGIDPSIKDIVQRDIDTINRLYGLNLESPPVRQGGVSYEYYMRVIIREDPKKPRVAFQSNPLQDYIGYPGMDVWAEIFKYCPWIQCGRKRDDDLDIIIDKHRWAEIQQVYQHNRNRRRNTISSDLSKATEHLNMIICQEITIRLLTIITGLSKEEVSEFVHLTSDQLYRSGITIEQHETCGVFYPSKGQTQGVPNSFHSMTGVLSLVNLQASLDSGLDEEDAKRSIQNNGDDATSPEIALEKFKELLALITGPGVFNQEKSFSSSINESLEFCKTIYYANNKGLITGYRLSTIYKMVKRPENLMHTMNGSFERERYIYNEFLEEYGKHIEPEIDGYSILISSEVFKNPTLIERIIQMSYLSEMIAMQRMYLKGNINIVNPYLLRMAPRDWRYLLHANKSVTLDEETILYADLKLIRSYLYENEDTIIPNKYEILVKEQDEYDRAILTIASENGISLTEPIQYILDDKCIILQENQSVVSAPELMRLQLGLKPDSHVIMEPRIGTNIDIIFEDDKIRTELRDSVVEQIAIECEIKEAKQLAKAIVSVDPEDLDIDHNLVIVKATSIKEERSKTEIRWNSVQKSKHNVWTCK